MSLRDMVFKYAADHYHTAPEYLWKSSPDYAVLRHKDNKKWYALIMNVPYHKLGLPGNGVTDVLEVKCPPDMMGPLLSVEGVLPAYHMHKGSWLSVLLDGSAAPDTIRSFLNTSFAATASQDTLRSGEYTPAGEWIIPANPKMFDLEAAFDQCKTISWHQKTVFIREIPSISIWPHPYILSYTNAKSWKRIFQTILPEKPRQPAGTCAYGLKGATLPANLAVRY